MENFINYVLSADRQVFYFFNNTCKNPVFDVIMPILTNEHIWIAPILLLAAGLLIYGNRKVKMIVVLMIIAVAFSDSICYRILKPWFGRIRPFLTLGHVNLLAGAGYLSFPSNHAANTFAMASVVLMFNRKLGWWLLGTAVVVSFSRIYCGVHYPLDILAGAAIGATIGLLTVFFYRSFKWKKEPKKQRS